jgi:hypothetical protein
VRSEGGDISASDVIVRWAEEGDGSEIVPTFRGMLETRRGRERRWNQRDLFSRVYDRGT